MLQEAHALVSLAGNVGLVELRRLCQGAEQAAKNGNADLVVEVERVAQAFSGGPRPFGNISVVATASACVAEVTIPS